MLLHPAVQALSALQVVLASHESALDQAAIDAANLQVWREIVLFVKIKQYIVDNG